MWSVVFSSFAELIVTIIYNLILFWIFCIFIEFKLHNYNWKHHHSIWKSQIHSVYSISTVVGKYISYHHHPAWLRTELQRVYRDTGMTEMDWVMGVERVTGITEGLSNGEYIFTRPQGIYHIISYRFIIQQLTHTIFLIFWSHLLIPRFCGSSESDSIKSSHPLSTLLQPELLLRTNSFWNALRDAVEC